MKANLSGVKKEVQLQQLDAYIWDIVSKGAISEYDLIKALQNPPYNVFTNASLQQQLDLYQTHFITYNSLYRLQKLGLLTNDYYLTIEALKIEVILLNESNDQDTYLIDNRSTLRRDEKLADFYLDWRNLETSEEKVEELITTFWKRYATLTNDDLTESLFILKLTKLPSQKALKTQYRKLSQQYHPDKGGDPKKFHALVKAFQKVNGAIPR